MAAYPGRKGMVYLSTDGTTAPTSVLKISKWTLDYSTSMIDVTAFLDSNKTYVPSLPDVKGTFSGFWDDTENKIFTAASSDSGCNLYLYPSADAPTYYWWGPAWLDASMDCGVSDAVTISGNFSARGSWAKSF